MEDIPLYIGKRKNILVLSGGGIKGISTLGALKYLYENEILLKPDIFCGTSVGGAICLLLNIGFSPIAIYNIFESIDFTQLITSDIENILDDTCFGFNSPDPMMYVLVTLLKNKNHDKKITFKELYNNTGSKLIVTGTCINDASIHFFSVDKTPDMEVLKAIRITISIPIFFKPFNHENKIWIDGACINNYPIDIFADKLNDVVGILLDDDYSFVENIEDMEKYFLRIFKCILRGTILNKYELFKKNTIRIICDCELSSNWELGVEIKKQLFNLGYSSAKKFYEKL